MIKKNIPNLFTILNLIFGCLGVLSISSLNFKATLILTIFCVFFDFLDGFFARLLKVKSEFGKELDSLADIVSFGLVPGFLMYKLYVITGFQEDFFLFFVLSKLSVNHPWMTIYYVPSHPSIHLAGYTLKLYILLHWVSQKKRSFNRRNIFSGTPGTYTYTMYHVPVHYSILLCKS